MKLSVFTSMTDPESRNDPYKEALECYEDFADELVIVGEDWPYEFKFDKIGQIFQEGFEKSTGDWVIRMDIDYFVHEKQIQKLKNNLIKYKEYPGVVFPQYQFFVPTKYSYHTNLCLAVNKTKFPDIKLNGGTDKILPTINNKILNFKKLPWLDVPIWQYDGIFRTKNIIAEDRARFARAWHRYSNNYDKRGGPTKELAYDAWFNFQKTRFKNHIFNVNIQDHPKYIKERLKDLKENQFGYSAFGIAESVSPSIFDYLKSYKNKSFFKIKSKIV